MRDKPNKPTGVIGSLLSQRYGASIDYDFATRLLTSIEGMSWREAAASMSAMNREQISAWRVTHQRKRDTSGLNVAFNLFAKLDAWIKTAEKDDRFRLTPACYFLFCAWLKVRPSANDTSTVVLAMHRQWRHEYNAARTARMRGTP